MNEDLRRTHARAIERLRSAMRRAADEVSTVDPEFAARLLRCAGCTDSDVRCDTCDGHLSRD